MLFMTSTILNPTTALWMWTSCWHCACKHGLTKKQTTRWVTDSHQQNVEH